MSPAKSNKVKPASGPVALLIGTRKGAFICSGDKTRQNWKMTNRMFIGATVHHMVMDPRDGCTILMTAVTGHLGPTVYRSTDLGKTWKEATKPPAFPKAAEGEKGSSCTTTFGYRLVTQASRMCGISVHLQAVFFAPKMAG